MLKERERSKDLALAALQYAVFGSVILYFARDISIPLSFAALISLVIYPSCKWLEERGFKRMSAILINISLILVILLGIMALLINQFAGFLEEWPTVESKLIESLKSVSEFMTESYDVPKEQQNKWLTQSFNSSGSGALVIF